MNYIVLDMEWNQASSYAEMVKNPVFLTGEIIQIGAVKLDQDFQVADSFNSRIVSQHYTTLHPKVAEITKLSERDLRKGETFPAVFDAFCDWYRALDIVHETPYDAHDALNDAKSTALVCRHLDMSRGLEEYREIVEHRDGIVECYEFEEPYLDIADALSDDYVVSFECPTCGEIVWGDNWVRKDGMTLLSLGQCDDGQEFLIKLKFRPAPNNKVSVKRFVYELTDALRSDYQACVTQTAAWSKYVIPAYVF